LKAFAGLDSLTRNDEMKYLLVIAEQKWNDKWSTFLRYANVQYDLLSAFDHNVWTVGTRYMYTPALQFELLYEKMSVDTDGFDDNMLRLRTSISF
jgi:hypothetical protein